MGGSPCTRRSPRIRESLCVRKSFGREGSVCFGGAHTIVEPVGRARCRRGLRHHLWPPRRRPPMRSSAPNHLPPSILGKIPPVDYLQALESEQGVELVQGTRVIEDEVRESPGGHSDRLRPNL